MKYWVFDLDGTLVDSFSHFFSSLSEIFDSHGKKFSRDLYLSGLTEPMAEFFERHLGKESVPAAMNDLQDRSNQDALHIKPFDGILPAIQQLKEGGARIAVWTNRDLTSAELILKHSGLSPFVEYCVSGSCVSQRKPSPEGLSRILDYFGCTADSVTMVGDHEHDVTSAKSVGVRAVRASWHSYWPVDPCDHADHQFHQVSNFSRWLAGGI